jgi:hypothetical protein
MVNCEELGNEIAQLAGRLNVATHRLLTCIRAFDEGDGWHRQGAQSCAHWLTWRLGLDPGAAREKVRVARALGELPRIDEVFAGGRLSYSQVRAVTRIANAANEQCVLDVALTATGAQLERICRGFRRATEGETEAARDRRVRARCLGDGLVRLEVVVSADEAELLLKAIEHARQQLTPAVVSERAPLESATDEALAPVAPRPSAADALIHIASLHLSGGAGTADPVALADVAAPVQGQVIIHLDRDRMSPDGALAGTLDDGTRVSAEALRRVACDGGLVTAVVDEQGSVLDIGRRTRAIPTAIRRALSIRDQHCRFPGCANRRFLHGHHIRHWLHGGPTSLDNLVSLCSFHHGQLHEGGFSVELTEDGQVVVRTPQGVPIPAQPALAADVDSVDWDGDWWQGSQGDTTIGTATDAWTATPTWDGEAVDYDAIVGALVSRDERPTAELS